MLLHNPGSHVLESEVLTLQLTASQSVHLGIEPHWGSWPEFRCW